MTTLGTFVPTFPTMLHGRVVRYCTVKANTPAPFTDDISQTRYRFEFVPAQFLGYVETLQNGEVKDTRALVNNAFYKVWPDSDARWPEIFQERHFNAAFEIEENVKEIAYAQ